MCFPMFVCLCHVPSCCCSCLHPSPVPNHPGCVYYWFLLGPVNSPCLVHLCHCLPRLDCSHLSLVICCLCVYIYIYIYIVLVFLFLVASSSLYVVLVCSLCFLGFPRVSSRSEEHTSELQSHLNLVRR